MASLALAEALFAGPHVSMTDDRFECGEVRSIAFGLIHDRHFACVYADWKVQRRSQGEQTSGEAPWKT
jgi:hypothetical protein